MSGPVTDTAHLRGWDVRKAATAGGPRAARADLSARWKKIDFDALEEGRLARAEREPDADRARLAARAVPVHRAGRRAAVGRVPAPCPTRDLGV